MILAYHDDYLQIKNYLKRFKSFEFRQNGEDYLYLIKSGYTLKIIKLNTIKVMNSECFTLLEKDIFKYNMKDKKRIIKFTIDFINNCIKLVNKMK